MRANIRGRYRCVKSSAPGTQPPTELHRGNDANGMIRQKKIWIRGDNNDSKFFYDRWSIIITKYTTAI